MPQALDYFWVFLLGALVGIAELVSRYRDAPRDVLYSLPALLYTALNAAASLLALVLIHAFGWKFGATGDAVRPTQVLVAGIGAMALLRTSLFTVRAGDKDIGVGPASFLQIFLATADREVDRVRARSRSDQAGRLMDGLDYQKAAEGLVEYCLMLMQNVPGDDQGKLRKAVELLNVQSIDEGVKVRILGLLLMNVVGPEVLSGAMETPRERMKTGGPP
jgi:hypothetical protein